MDDRDVVQPWEEDMIPVIVLVSVAKLLLL